MKNSGLIFHDGSGQLALLTSFHRLYCFSVTDFVIEFFLYSFDHGIGNFFVAEDITSMQYISMLIGGGKSL